MLVIGAKGDFENGTSKFITKIGISIIITPEICESFVYLIIKTYIGELETERYERSTMHLLGMILTSQ